MSRVQVIQQIIHTVRARSYLEIGVSTGSCFFPIKAPRKLAVDPDFRLSWKRKLLWTHRNFSSEYHSLTSDDFFTNITVPSGLDVVFVDGLHTWQQALRDVENSLQILNEGGVIIMHDCNPTTAAIGHPADSLSHAASLNLPGWTGEWCGDVWKAVCQLRTRPDLRVFVLDCDYGLGIVTRGHSDDTLALSREAIADLVYSDLEKKRREYLNLKDTSYFQEFLSSLGPTRSVRQ